MSRATTGHREFVERLVSYEARGNKPSGTKGAGAFPGCEKLRAHFSTLMGSSGFRALLSRALALANAEVPWLCAIHVRSDGALEGFDDLEKQIEQKDIFEGEVALLTQLLGLLVAFIGENLTLRLVSEVWPKLSFNDLEFGKGDNHEK